MKPRFEIGDRVSYKPCKLCGSVINSFHTVGICAVTFDEDGLPRHIYENDLEFENPKAAFLTRLQELLATFDAKISGGGDGYGNYMACCIGNGKSFSLGEEDEFGIMSTVTAQNIFNHDKD